MATLWSESWAYANGTSPATITPGLTGTGGSVAVQSNKLRLTSGTAVGGAGKVSRRAVLAVQTAYEVSTTATLVSTTGDYTGDVHVRVDAAVDGASGYSIFYRMNVDEGYFQWQVVKAVNYTYTSIYTSAQMTTVIPGTTLGIRLRVVGGVVQARVWNANATEPSTWPCNYTDATPYNTAGYVGFDCYATTGANRVIDLGAVTVTDGATVVSNVAPTANAGSNQTGIAPFQTVNLNGSATDTDGTVSAYAWTQTGGPTVTLSGTGANRTFKAPALRTASTLTFQLVATDNQGASSSPSSVTVGVTRAPLLRHNGADWYGVQVLRSPTGGATASGTAALRLNASGAPAAATPRAATGTSFLALSASGSGSGSPTMGTLRTGVPKATTVWSTWTAATAASSTPVTGYIVYRNGVQVATRAADELAYTHTGLTANTQYVLEVAAVNSVGTSARASITITTASA